MTMEKGKTSPDGQHSSSRTGSVIRARKRKQSGKKHLDRFGWGRFKPRCLHFLNNAPFLLFCLTMLLTIQNVLVNGLLPASITHIERRFHVTSAEVGGFVCMYDTAYMLALFPICYYGSRGHKSRWIGAAALLTSLGSIICILPHFLAEDYEYGSDTVGTYCSNDNATSTDDCGNVIKGEGLKAFFFVAEFLFGVAVAPMTTIAVTFLDENVSQRASSTYISIYSAANLLGPCIGYTAGAFLSRIYGHITVDTRTLPMKSHEDPRWYGAWWIGVLGCGLISGCLALPIYGFGRELPGKAELRAKDVDEAHRGAISLHVSVSDAGWSSLKHQLKILATNPTYVSLIVEQFATIFVVGGLSTFATKYLETQFSLTTWGASAYAAMTGIPPALIGTLIGTVLQRCMTLKCRGNIVLSIIGTTLATFCWMVFTVTCPTRPFAGVNRFADDSRGIKDNLKESCNLACSCKMARFEPSCWTGENISFFSKCHAGCIANATNCSCTGIEESMTEGLCSTECSSGLILQFLIGLGTMILFASMKKNLVEQATLRCVPFSMRTFALALGGIPKKLLGSIPATPFMGFVLKYNCLVWQEKCGHKEVCIVYDNVTLASHVQLAGAIGFTIASIALFVAVLCYNAPPEKEVEKSEAERHSIMEEVLRLSWNDPVFEP